MISLVTLSFAGHLALAGPDRPRGRIFALSRVSRPRLAASARAGKYYRLLFVTCRRGISNQGGSLSPYHGYHSKVTELVTEVTGG